MTGTYSKNIYINYDMNKNELRNLVIGSASYLSPDRPNANGLQDKGLLYYDQVLGHIMVWNGYSWKFTQYLDERDYVSTQNIMVENIWTQTNLISTTAATIVDALNLSPVVSFLSITMSYVSGSYYFNDDTSTLIDIIPNSYGSIYVPVLKDYNGIVIPPTDYKLEGNQVLFVTGFTDQTNVNGYSPAYTITATYTPEVNFLRYIGTRGNFAYSGQSFNIVNIPSIFTNSSPYEVRVLPPSFNPLVANTTNTFITINGISVYDWSLTFSYGTFSQNLLIVATNSIGYPIDALDAVVIVQ